VASEETVSKNLNIVVFSLSLSFKAFVKLHHSGVLRINILLHLSIYFVVYFSTTLITLTDELMPSYAIHFEER